MSEMRGFFFFLHSVSLLVIFYEDCSFSLAVSSKSNLCGQLVNKDSVSRWEVNSERRHVLNPQYPYV